MFFLGVDGMKIFRDLIYQMRADHRFFKSHNQYDFPQKHWRMGNEKLKAKMGNRMSAGMIKPYKDAIIIRALTKRNATSFGTGIVLVCSEVGKSVSGPS